LPGPRSAWQETDRVLNTVGPSRSWAASQTQQGPCENHAGQTCHGRVVKRGRRNRGDAANRLSRRSLTLVLGVAAAVILVLPAARAEDQGAGPGVLSATPREFRAGEDVAVSGEGCAPESEVRFSLYNPNPGPSATGLARGDGTFAEVVHIPGTAKAGKASLRATCLDPDAETTMLQAPLMVHRPGLVVAWTNVLLGLGMTLFVAGLGLAMARRPKKSAGPFSLGRQRSARRVSFLPRRNRVVKGGPCRQRQESVAREYPGKHR
jgi:hypothetical protein